MSKSKIEKQNIFDLAKDALAKSIPFSSHFGLELIDATSDLIRIRMAFKETLTRANGSLHGGALMTLADISGVVCASIHTIGHLAGTQQFSISFLRPGSGTYIDAISKTVHNGRTSLVVQTSLENDAGKCIAVITQTQAVRQNQVTN